MDNGYMIDLMIFFIRRCEKETNNNNQKKNADDFNAFFCECVLRICLVHLRVKLGL